MDLHEFIKGLPFFPKSRWDRIKRLHKEMDEKYKLSKSQIKASDQKALLKVIKGLKGLTLLMELLDPPPPPQPLPPPPKPKEEEKKKEEEEDTGVILCSKCKTYIPVKEWAEHLYAHNRGAL